MRWYDNHIIIRPDTRGLPMPIYKPVHSGRLYEGIVRQIEQRILDGALKAGDRFPSERELAEQFGVSRTAVREAMKVLREKGLTESFPGRGAFVTNGTSRAVRHSLGLMMKIEQGEGAENIVEVREIIEPAIAAQAALRRTDDHLAAMQDALAIMESTDDPSAFIEADLDFHVVIAEAAQNDLILILLDSIIDLLREQRRHVFFVTGGAARGRYYHKLILDAIARRDPEAARQAMRAHMQQVRQDNQTAVSEVG